MFVTWNKLIEVSDRWSVVLDMVIMVHYNTIRLIFTLDIWDKYIVTNSPRVKYILCASLIIISGVQTTLKNNMMRFTVEITHSK